jgi:Flp pilus assembly pilin Flp
VKSTLRKNHAQKRIQRFLADDTAATAIEYAVILTLIIMVAITGIAALGSQTGGLWGGIQSKLQGVSFGHR